MEAYRQEKTDVLGQEPVRARQFLYHTSYMDWPEVELLRPSLQVGK
jgi:hypothetical protein